MNLENVSNSNVFNPPSEASSPPSEEVIGKRLNRGGGYGLEIPVIYHFHGQEKLVNWAVKKLEAVKNQLDCQKLKCLK